MSYPRHTEALYELPRVHSSKRCMSYPGHTEVTQGTRKPSMSYPGCLETLYEQPREYGCRVMALCSWSSGHLGSPSASYYYLFKRLARVQVLAHILREERQFTVLETLKLKNGAEKIFFPNETLYILTFFLLQVFLSSFGCQVRESVKPFLRKLFPISKERRVESILYPSENVSIIL